MLKRIGHHFKKTANEHEIQKNAAANKSDVFPQPGEHSLHAKIS